MVNKLKKEKQNKVVRFYKKVNGLDTRYIPKCNNAKKLTKIFPKVYDYEGISSKHYLMLKIAGIQTELLQ